MNAPPFLLGHNSSEDFIRCCTGINQFERTQLESLIKLNLPPVSSVESMAVLFGYSPNFIRSMMKNKRNYYRIFTIRKGAKKRQIQAPRVALKIIQKWFATYLANSITLDDCVHGFVTGKSSISAAQVHCGAEWVYSIDIKDFFPTTTGGKVATSLKELGYSDYASLMLAELCCIDGNLAQGSPASPALSNLVFKMIDEQIKILAAQHNAKYTRYADDLVFSGTGPFPEDIRNAKQIVESHGWVVSKEKESLNVAPQRLKVHGLVVHQDKPRLTKGYRKRIRAYKHLSEHNRIKDEDKAKVRGHLAYARAVESII